jgi:hypothetical protein
LRFEGVRRVLPLSLTTPLSMSALRLALALSWLIASASSISLSVAPRSPRFMKNAWTRISSLGAIFSMDLAAALLVSDPFA